MEANFPTNDARRIDTTWIIYANHINGLFRGLFFSPLADVSSPIALRIKKFTLLSVPFPPHLRNSFSGSIETISDKWSVSAPIKGLPIETPSSSSSNSNSSKRKAKENHAKRKRFFSDRARCGCTVLVKITPTEAKKRKEKRKRSARALAKKRANQNMKQR